MHLKVPISHSKMFAVASKRWKCIICTQIYSTDCQSVGPIGLPSTEPMPRVFNFIVQFFGLLKRSALFNQFLLDLQFQVDDISPAGTERAVSLGLSVRSAEGSAPEGSSWHIAPLIWWIVKFFASLALVQQKQRKRQGKAERKRKIKAHIGEGELAALNFVNLCLPELTLHWICVLNCHQRRGWWGLWWRWNCWRHQCPGSLKGPHLHCGHGEWISTTPQFISSFFFFLPNWGNRWDTTWLFWEIAALLEQFLASTQAKRVSRAKSSEIGVDNSLFYTLKLCKKLSLL